MNNDWWAPRGFDQLPSIPHVNKAVIWTAYTALGIYVPLPLLLCSRFLWFWSSGWGGVTDWGPGAVAFSALCLCWLACVKALDLLTWKVKTDKRLRSGAERAENLWSSSFGCQRCLGVFLHTDLEPMSPEGLQSKIWHEAGFIHLGQTKRATACHANRLHTYHSNKYGHSVISHQLSKRYFSNWEDFSSDPPHTMRTGAVRLPTYERRGWKGVEAYTRHNAR
jgi:hypothetical protein